VRDRIDRIGIIGIHHYLWLYKTCLCRLKVVIKALVGIGGNLSHHREYKDLFEDLAVKVIPPPPHTHTLPTQIRIRGLINVLSSLSVGVAYSLFVN
jgi:hypothetical protein